MSFFTGLERYGFCELRMNVAGACVDWATLCFMLYLMPGTKCTYMCMSVSHATLLRLSPFMVVPVQREMPGMAPKYSRF